MKKFVVIYRMPQSSMDEMKDMSAEDTKKGMDLWAAWAEKCGDRLVDLGTPLGDGQKITKSGSMASDGDIVGYSILQAENMKAAKTMLKNHPHLDWADGCEIEVYESLPLPS